MNKITPFNNIVLAQLLEKKKESIISLPDDKQGRFIRIRILDKGSSVHAGIRIDSICIANNMLEIIDPVKPDIGFINEKDILGREDETKKS